METIIKMDDVKKKSDLFILAHTVGKRYPFEYTGNASVTIESIIPCCVTDRRQQFLLRGLLLISEDEINIIMKLNAPVVIYSHMA